MDYVVVGLPGAVAQEETETETQEPHGEEPRNPVLPATEELIWGAISFAVLFLVLARFAFPALRRIFEARQEKIRTDLEKAEQARGEAETQLRRYEEQLREARAESGRIVEEARKTAESLRRDLLAKAEDEARQVVARAQEEIRAERDRVFQELRRQVAELSVELASRVVGEALDQKRHARLVDEYIEELATGVKGNGGAAAGAARGAAARSGAQGSKAQGSKAQGSKAQGSGAPGRKSPGKAPAQAKRGGGRQRGS